MLDKTRAIFNQALRAPSSKTIAWNNCAPVFYYVTILWVEPYASTVIQFMLLFNYERKINIFQTYEKSNLQSIYLFEKRVVYWGTKQMITYYAAW